MSRGVLWIVYGDKADAVLERSRASVTRWHPELEQDVVRLDAEHPAGLLRKAEMFELSQFDETLFLDADTVLLDRVDQVFLSAHNHGLTAAICECPWARRYQGSGLPLESVEMNTGVVAWSKNHRTPQVRADPYETAEVFFAAWKRHAASMDSSITWVSDQDTGSLLRMPMNDQASFTAALIECDINPAVLPTNYNLRPQWQKSWFGPVKIWHAYEPPPALLLAWADYYRRPGHFIQYHELDSLKPPVDVVIPESTP
jgi:hypothetical protein